MDAIDITDILPTEEHVLEILSPQGTSTGWKVTLCPANHPKASAFAEAQAKHLIEREKVIREAQFNGQRFEGEEKTPDQNRRESVKWVVARIVDWTPVKIAGKVYDFSDKNAEDLLIRPELGFAFNQITRALNQEARFTKRSAAS